jgi:hypothetical protein
MSKNVSWLGDSAFLSTKWEENARVGDFVIINNILYAYHGKGGNVVIPKGVKQIGGHVFSTGGYEDKSKLKSVTIPDSVKIIRDNAFSGCEGLKSIVLPEGITQIGMYAFADCYNLKELTIKGNIKEISSDAFMGCDLLTLYVNKGSKAEEFAKKYKIHYKFN